MFRHPAVTALPPPIKPTHTHQKASLNPWFWHLSKFYVHLISRKKCNTLDSFLLGPETGGARRRQGGRVVLSVGPCSRRYDSTLSLGPMDRWTVLWGLLEDPTAATYVITSSRSVKAFHHIKTGRRTTPHPGNSEEILLFYIKKKVRVGREIYRN